MDILLCEVYDCPEGTA